MWVVNFLGNFSHYDFFQNKLFRKILSGIQTVSNSLNPDQVGRSVMSDLGPNCLQKLSADDTRG